MKQVTLLITLLFLCTTSFAQNSHPKDREVEAAVLAYIKEDSGAIIEDYKYLQTMDLSKKEYAKMTASRFESFMFAAEQYLKMNNEQQKEYTRKRDQHEKDTRSYKVYCDTLAQLTIDRENGEDMYDRNKISFDSCLVVAQNADSTDNYAYMAFITIRWKHGTPFGDSYVAKGVTQFLVSKDMETHLYRRLDEPDPLFPENK